MNSQVNSQMNLIPHIFVVSLPRCTKRRQQVQHRLGALGLGYEMFDAVDGAAMDPRQDEPRLNKEYWRRLRGRDLSAGEIGAFMSHYKVWESMINRDLETAIVLEDNCFFEPDFADTVRDVTAAQWQWDIVLLSAKKRFAVDRTLCEVGNGRHLVRFRRRVGTTRAYLLTITAARRLVEYCGQIRAPIDWLYAEWWLNGLRFYAVSPAVAVRDQISSTIGRPSRRRRTLGEYLWAKKELTLSFARRRIALCTVAPRRKP